MSVLTVEQEQRNKVESDEYDALIAAQRDRYVDLLSRTCDSASNFKCTETTAEDWLDTPEI